VGFTRNATIINTVLTASNAGALLRRHTFMVTTAAMTAAVDMNSMSEAHAH
jgi:hypothetical protein